jgi:hypothetical protein
LYDLKRDRSEQHDQAKSQPATVEKMSAMWQKLDSGFVERREKAAPTTKTRMKPA